MAQSLSISGSMPDAALFNWPPTSHPAPLPPAPAPSTVMHPFNIPDNVFTAALDARVPLTIATLYAVSVKLLNKYNKANGKKAWGISKTRPFFAFVVLHNIFLAVYSAWTFWGMLGGMKRSWVSPFAGQGTSGTADFLCRLHGEPGVGNSIFFDDETQTWMSLASNTGAIVNGLPSNTQPGRIWTEGLAYYGWIFYLSKFYEVLDTFIILAKGKPSSTLQTYHHAGAMMCMWAGVRFMSAPIWVFVLVNSFIHALMYTYYTLTAFSIKVPVTIKRTLTTMQITQFLVGASYAMVHSFVSYTVPVTINNAAESTQGTGSDAESPLDALKNMVFGGSPSAPSASTAPSSQSVDGTETVYTTQPCIATAGETFAIWLNVLYLAPLTYLFVSFFIASYVKRANKATSGQDNVALAEKAGWDAARGVEREIYNGENMVNGSGSGSPVNGSPKGSQKKKAGGKKKA